VLILFFLVLGNLTYLRRRPRARPGEEP